METVAKVAIGAGIVVVGYLLYTRLMKPQASQQVDPRVQQMQGAATAGGQTFRDVVGGLREAVQVAGDVQSLINKQNDIDRARAQQTGTTAVTNKQYQFSSSSGVAGANTGFSLGK